MSSERSGSNLLRSILDSHSEIAAPPALQLFRQFNKILPYYGSLNDVNNYELLVDDVLKIVNLKETHNEWEHEISAKELLPSIQSRTLTDLIIETYGMYSKKEGKEIFVCKENDLFKYAFEILYRFPESKMIYLIRDGRDVASSEKSIEYRNRHIFLLAEDWLREQEQCTRVYQNLAPKNALLVRYEDLIADTERSLKKICAFLEINYTEDLLNFHAKNNIKQQSGKTEFWKNLSSPIMKGNLGKFKDHLSAKEIEIFESVAGEYLKFFDYQCVNAEVKQIDLIKEASYRIKNKLYKFYRKSDKKIYEHHFKINKTFDAIKNTRRSNKRKFAL